MEDDAFKSLIEVVSDISEDDIKAIILITEFAFRMLVAAPRISQEVLDSKMISDDLTKGTIASNLRQLADLTGDDLLLSLMNRYDEYLRNERR